jgi:hypothetical protein
MYFVRAYTNEHMHCITFLASTNKGACFGIQLLPPMHCEHYVLERSVFDYNGLDFA